ncbi:response regulator [Paramagnetospirillum kuznetsovii]|uniref:Response regulator n=1 Tax=Paramagnetospirillum kuznetsovii TaxID=2053833 RepID=A0A364NX91_9PROT|nr:response regulator [Paramagnetospirillum kuznetsovii]RAU21527.1 response regulator [Paramagnetospirillum kuznetsovii]
MADLAPKFPSSPAQAIDLSRVKALVCEPSGLLRQGIRLALNNIGVRTINEANTFLAAHKACEEGDHDFLIVNQEIEANDATYILRQMRAGNLGKDPFIVTVMLLSSRDEPKVRAAMDSGPDDLLLIPFAPDQLMNRLRMLVERRKPFVVTHDYIGPDRRTSPRPGATSATQFQVPNPMRARGQGVPPDRYLQAKQDAATAIAVERIKRLAATIEWECNALLVSFRESRASGETNFRSLVKLDSVCEEMSGRVTKTLGHTTDVIDGFLIDIRKLKNSPSTMTYSDVEHLSTTGRKITGTYTSR